MQNGHPFDQDVYEFKLCKMLVAEMVRRELWTTLLAYNLIRTTICSAASLHGKRPREISFVAASQYILASWQEVTAILRGKQLERYARLLLERIASCKVGHRPVGLNREL